MLLVSILDYILTVIGAIILLIILIPYDYYAYGKKLDECYIKCGAAWLFGGINIGLCKCLREPMETSITILGIRKKIRSEKKHRNLNKTQEKTKTHGKKKGSAIQKNLSGELIKKVFTAVVKILYHCKPRRLYINARVGFEDPSHTGLLCAAKGIAYKFFSKHTVRIETVFDDEILEGRFFIRGRIWLFYLILVTVGTLLTKPFRNIWISSVKAKIKGGA